MASETEERPAAYRPESDAFHGGREDSSPPPRRTYTPPPPIYDDSDELDVPDFLK